MKKQNFKLRNCFYICGLTGGPFFPIPAIKEQIENLGTGSILIGVLNSYESNLANKLGFSIEYLPKAKLDLLSFKNQSLSEILQGIYKLILSILLFVCSLFKSLYLIIKYRPILIYSTGSFLSVPMLLTAKFTNFFKITNTKIAVHQQDAIIGLANRLTAQLADLKSCVFPYTKEKYLKFRNAELIPNPIITTKYKMENLWQDKKLEKFVKVKITNKPLLLIFGGGSGAMAINNWVYANITELLTKFRVIHLTGLLQREIFPNNLVVENNSFFFEEMDSKANELVQSSSITLKNNSNYYTQQSVIEDMPTLLVSVDLVICRAGLGSISELAYLNKPTFLVPLPNSHQVKNAELITKANSNFKILNQQETNNWLESVSNAKFEKTINSFDQKALDEYYVKLTNLLS